MGKHDRTQREKELRNTAYATKYRQLVCKLCGHASCLKGRCRGCGAEAKHRRPRRL